MDLFRQNSATREDLGMLAVMDALATEDQITQRELSRQTGLNLKKVHFCLHKLLEKGYVKFQRALHNPDKRVYLYIVTPAGLKAKSALTYRFLKVTLDFYNQVEAKVQQTLAAMEKAGIERVVLGQRCGPHGAGADPRQWDRSGRYFGRALSGPRIRRSAALEGGGPPGREMGWGVDHRTGKSRSSRALPRGGRCSDNQGLEALLTRPAELP